MAATTSIMVATAAAEIRSVRHLAPGRPHQLDPSGIQQRPQPTVEEQQHQESAVDAVGVGIGEHEHPLIPRPLRRTVGLEAGSDRGGERPEERMLEHLSPRGPGGVEGLALHREHGLDARIPHPGDRGGRGIALDHDQLGPRAGTMGRAIVEFGHRAVPARKDARHGRKSPSIRDRPASGQEIAG